MTDIGWAVSRLREGMKITRDGWSAVGQYVVLVDGELIKGIANGASRSGTTFVWQPTAADLLAKDWLCASRDGSIYWPDGTVA